MNPLPLLRTLVLIALLGPGVFAATTYYVDSAGGNDANAGTSSSAPWKNVGKVNATTFAAGDTILFKRGSSWTNTLWPKGSGTSSASITVDAYGTGAAPLIQGGGSDAAFYLYNQQYWTIKNLELTNTGSGTAVRNGVHIKAEDFGTVNGIHLIDLEVHAVDGDITLKENGGIYLEIAGTATATKWNDLLIDGCYVHDVTRTGIINSSSWDDRTATVNTNWTPSTNVAVRNCVVAACAANGLVLRVATALVIEQNVFANNGHSESGNAMFVFNCDDALIQFNEAYGTVFNTGDTDAAGFDGATVENQRIGRLLEHVQIRLRLNATTNGRFVQNAIGLAARRAHGRAFRRVERAPLDAGFVGGCGHRAAERVDLAHEMALADPADRGIAAHLADGLDVVRQKQRARAGPRARERGFRAGVAAADDDDVVVVHESSPGRSG